MIRTVGEVVKESDFTNLKEFRNDVFYFETDKGFKFNVPLEDFKGVTVFGKEKTIYYMRWIRREIELQNQLAEMLASQAKRIEPL